MRELFKKAKQNSLFGGKVKRMLGFKAFALAMLMLVGVTFAASAYATGDAVMEVMCLAVAAAPVAFAVPDIPGLSDADREGMKALAKYFNDRMDEFKSGSIDGEELNKRVKEAFETFVKDYGPDKEKFKKLEDALKAQGLEIKALKECGKGDAKPLREQLKELFSEENIHTVEMAKGTTHMIGMELKAAATITTANAANAPHTLSFEVVPGIHAAPEETPVILTALNKGRTSSRTIYWVNRVNGEGGAAFIAEGALKPLMDWDYKEETSSAKKVAVSAKVSHEMLKDFDYIESEIRLLLTRDLYREIDDRLLKGKPGASGASANPNDPEGIITKAGGYVGTGVDGTVVMPNNADAIRAAMLQMRLLNYKPDVVFMNPTDAAVIDLTKSSTGNYIKIELEGVLRSLRIVETTAIPADSFLLMDTAKWTVKILEDLRIEFGWENDDFRRNLITVIAELRLHSYQNSIDAGSVIYDSFAAVKTALEVA